MTVSTYALGDRGARGVYFIGAGGNSPIKVGYADRPFVRLVELQCGNPNTLLIHDVVQGEPWVERTLHQHLKPYRIRGEWFQATAARGVLRLLHDGVAFWRLTPELIADAKARLDEAYADHPLDPKHFGLDWLVDDMRRREWARWPFFSNVIVAPEDSDSFLRLTDGE